MEIVVETVEINFLITYNIDMKPMENKQTK